MPPTSLPLHVMKISEGDAFSVLNYFHVCPESADGRHVAYTQFPDGPHESQKGDANVMVCDPDGNHQQCVGQTSQVRQHRGACPTWIDDQHLAYSQTGDGHGPVHVVNVESGEEKTYDGGMDNYSPALERTYFNAPFEGEDAVWYLDLKTGRRHVAVTMDRIMAFSRESGFPIEPAGLAHAYITPSGHKIAFRVGGEEKVIILADPDGANLQMFGKKMMHWQFFDDASLFGHDDVFEGDKHMRRWDLSGEIIEEPSYWKLQGPAEHPSIHVGEPLPRVHICQSQKTSRRGKLSMFHACISPPQKIQNTYPPQYGTFRNALLTPLPKHWLTSFVQRICQRTI